MLLLIILICFLVWIWIGKEISCDDKVFLSFILTMVISGIALTIGLTYQPEIKRENVYLEIYSLKNSTSVEGSFTLGSGYIQETENYFVFYKDADGAFRRWSAPVRDCRLFLKNETPFIHYQKVTCKSPFWLTYISPSEETTTLFNMVVPENTLVQKFEVF